MSGVIVAAPSATTLGPTDVPLPQVAPVPGSVDAFDLTGQLLPVPAQLSPGDVVLVRAAGFLAGEELLVTHDDAAVTDEASVTDEQGRVERRFVVPASQISGTHTLVMQGRTSTAAWSYQVGVVRAQLASARRGPAGSPSPVIPGLVGIALVAAGAGLRHTLLTQRPTADVPVPGSATLTLSSGLSVVTALARTARPVAHARHARPPAPRRGRHAAR